MNIPNVVLFNASMGYGRTSLAAAIPLLSALGVKSVPVPTVLISAPTGGFGEVYRQDTPQAIAGYIDHFTRMELKMDGAATGYISSVSEMEVIGDYLATLNCPRLVDPVFADHGRVYSGFTNDHVAALRRLVRRGTVITPNLTEAAFLLGRPMPDAFTEQEARDWLRALQDFGVDQVVITSAVMKESPQDLSTLAASGNQAWAVTTPLKATSFFGTGDALAAILIGELVQGMDFPQAVLTAVDFVHLGIEDGCAALQSARDGMRLELLLPRLLQKPYQPELHLIELH